MIAFLILFIAMAGSTAKACVAFQVPEVRISPEHPLILLQSSAAFGDADSSQEQAKRVEEARRHGEEIVRVWNLLPSDIRPLCQIQIELRVQEHSLRKMLFEEMLRPVQANEVAVSLQIADPHDEYVFDLNAVESLLQTFPCIKSLMVSEQQFAHYAKFNVEDYAVPPHVRYCMDVIQLGAHYGKHTVLVLQGLKWLHIGADTLNRPLLEAMRSFSDYVIPVNEHIEPRHLTRQTAVWGLWLGDFVTHWGVEPQSWWFESSFMNTPGIFGDHLHPAEMPPEMYRPMILQGAAMGATVYSFEPWWDLFDYGNSRCWAEVILPTLREVIQSELIPSKEQVLEKTPVAYQLAPARSIHDFHINMRDLDWLSDDGTLAQLVYGVWEPMLEFELVPNKSNWFIPLLPAVVSEEAAGRFPRLLHAGDCDDEACWREQLSGYLKEPASIPQAWTCEINDHAYVMHTHENLYEKQFFEVETAQPVRNITASLTENGSLQLNWDEVPQTASYEVCFTSAKGSTAVLATVSETSYVVNLPEPGKFSVTCSTRSRERYSGSVNYLDCLVFSQRISRPVEHILFTKEGTVLNEKEEAVTDTRPESQQIYPDYSGVPEQFQRLAEEVTGALDEFKNAYESMDWKRLTALYDPAYEDANGFHREYVSRAWKWWFRRNNKCFLLRQIRNWDFSEYSHSEIVKNTLFLYCTAVRWDDQPFGYDGIVRIPRHKGAEVQCSWIKKEGRWRLLKTEPSLPNLEEILWNSRPMDKEEKLVPSLDE